MTRWLRQTLPADPAGRLVSIAALLLPVFVMYSRSGTELLVGGIDLYFLFGCWRRRDWGWLRQLWVVAALAWWGWTMLCSLPLPGRPASWHALIEAISLGRFFLLAAALAIDVLRTGPMRRVMLAVLAVAAAWIALECWQQYLLGADLFGWRRWSDGALTGPFRQPRAGPQLVLILFPALLPATSALLRRGTAARLGGVALFAVAIATMVLIGQRMPALLTGLGLLACAAALPRLRPAVVAAAAIGLVVLVATPIVSPPTFQKLVVHFLAQMRHFQQSDYGQIYIRATAIGLDHWLFGAGFDGFRAHCAEPRYLRGVAALGLHDNGVASGCNIHPHNHYLEALTAGGLPGLVLFCLLAIAWVAATAGASGQATPGQIGCCVTVLLALWPFASSSAFFTLPNAGWFFVVLGTGLALARRPDRGGRPGALPPIKRGSACRCRLR